MMEHVDGIYSEMADIDASGWTHGLGAALVAMNKPVVMWNHPKTMDTPLAEFAEALKGCLYIGAYPTVPVRNNDHAIGGDCAPNCTYDSVYAAFGPLFAMMKGKRWLLTPRAVTVVAGPPGTVANIFSTYRGIVAVVMQPQSGQGQGQSSQESGAGATIRIAVNTPLTFDKVTSVWPGGESARVPYSKGDAAISSALKDGIVLLLLE